MAVRKMIMGRKVGMTQLFGDDGRAIPVTVLEAGPCFVVQRRSKARDGYEAVQLGFLPYEERDVHRAEELHRLHERRRKTGDRGKVEREPRGPHRLTLAIYGHFLKVNVPPMRVLHEFDVAVLDDFPEGKEIRADLFAAGDKVDVSGISKGRGFAGVVQAVWLPRWPRHARLHVPPQTGLQPARRMPPVSLRRTPSRAYGCGENHGEGIDRGARRCREKSARYQRRRARTNRGAADRDHARTPCD